MTGLISIDGPQEAAGILCNEIADVLWQSDFPAAVLVETTKPGHFLLRGQNWQFTFAGEPSDSKKTLEVMFSHLPWSLQLIIGENLPISGVSTVVLGTQSDSMMTDKKIIAQITASSTGEKETAPWPVFERDNTEGTATFLWSQRFASRYDSSFSLRVNGRTVGCKDFVQDFITGTVCGMLKSLKHVEHIESVELKFLNN